MKIHLVAFDIVGVTGFEPATPWSQTRCSSQAEPHPDISSRVSRLPETQDILYGLSNLLSTLFCNYFAKFVKSERYRIE